MVVEWWQVAEQELGLEWSVLEPAENFVWKSAHFCHSLSLSLLLSSEIPYHQTKTKHSLY